MLKRVMKYSLYLLLAILLFSSCEKNITIDLPIPADTYVVEGHIESGSFPYVILTKNSPYYASFSTSDLNSYFVHNAVIKVSDGTKTVTLTEITFDTAGVKASVYIAPDMIGEIGKTYSLTVDVGETHITSITTIPQSYPLDSAWVKMDADPDDAEHVRLICRYTDPPTRGQYVRYFTRRNSEPFFPGLNSVFEDAIVNGTTFDFPLDRGVNRSDSANFNDYGYFFRGDTVEVKWCNIDKANFDFWRTLEFELGNNGNPFATPTHIVSNIVGGLGTWGGYAVSYRKLIVPK